MKHKHHIIPKHMGGTDDLSNIIELSVEEHAQAHLTLYEQYGKKEDLCAYYMLAGKNQDPEFCKLRAHLGGKAAWEKRKQLGIGHLSHFGAELTEEEKFAGSSKGGKIGGKRNAESGHIQEIRKLVNLIEAGKKGGARTIELRKGSFGNPEERLKSASKGGKTQGKRNAESDHLVNISRQYWDDVAAGKIHREVKQWYYSDTDRKSILIKDAEEVPEGYVKGRKIKW